MSKDFQCEKPKAVNLSDRAIARRVLIVEHLSNIYARVNSVKSGLLAQEDIKSIDDMFRTVMFCVDMVHDMIVGSKIIELEPAAENAEGEQLENNSEMAQIIAGVKEYVKGRLSAVKGHESLSPGVLSELMNIRTLLGR
jgi:hypothetical protein